jgi:alpha-L-fucosidase
LIREFVDECHKNDLVPFFYHTLLDWKEETYQTDFPKYIDYLVSSIEILCKNYGKIGGFWFDGMWSKPDEDWQEDRLYGTIRKYQPEAMIINNTGLDELGKVGHPEIDSVTFERGAPAFVDNSDKHRAGEMCQVLNDHWGYAEWDCNYKSVKELLENLVDCRKFGCNFLLNTGLRGDGSVNAMDACILAEIGKWVSKYGEAVYNVKPCKIKAENAELLQGEGCYYAVIKDVPMSADPNVQRAGNSLKVRIDGEIIEAEWLDNGEKIEVEQNAFYVVPFTYGNSYSVRIAKLKIK